MQDRYVADVGDFGKYGLLRCLAGITCGSKNDKLKLGVIWYLTPSCLGNANDGRHLSYLDQPQKFEGCDEPLFCSLGHLRDEITNVQNGVRIRKDECMRTEANNSFQDKNAALERVQDSKFLENTLFYDEPLRANTDRGNWWKKARKKLKGKCDLVFMDPDNGLRVQYGIDGANLLGWDEAGQKHISKEEISEVLNEWRISAVVIYHHLGRHGGGHDRQIRLIADALDKVAPKGTTIRALRYRRGSSRAFFVLIRKQEKMVPSRINSLAGSPWVTKNHFQIVL